MAFVYTMLGSKLGSKALFRLVLGSKTAEPCVEEFRAEVLESDDLTEEAAILLLLLKQSCCLNYYFSKHEQIRVRAALKRVAAMKDKKVFMKIRRSIMLLDLFTWS